MRANPLGVCFAAVSTLPGASVARRRTGPGLERLLARDELASARVTPTAGSTCNGRDELLCAHGHVRVLLGLLVLGCPCFADRGQEVADSHLFKRPRCWRGTVVHLVKSTAPGRTTVVDHLN